LTRPIWKGERKRENWGSKGSSSSLSRPRCGTVTRRGRRPGNFFVEMDENLARRGKRYATLVERDGEEELIGKEGKVLSFIELGGKGAL